jgi:hypothetical protein
MECATLKDAVIGLSAILGLFTVLAGMPDKTPWKSLAGLALMAPALWLGLQ